jgi:Rieske Fe-S protein
MSDDQTVTGQFLPTRRALLVGAGAVGATVVLSACGNDTESPAGEPAAGGDVAGAKALTTKGDVPVGSGKIFAGQGVVVTQPTAGEFKAFSAICTHQGCPVTSVDGGTINCSCHGSKFSIEDGSVKTGPASKPLVAKDVTVDGDTINVV